jgi:hypothetical protein
MQFAQRHLQLLINKALSNLNLRKLSPSGPSCFYARIHCYSLIRLYPRKLRSLQVKISMNQLCRIVSSRFLNRNPIFRCLPHYPLHFIVHVETFHLAARSKAFEPHPFSSFHHGATAAYRIFEAGDRGDFVSGSKHSASW